MIDNLVGQHFGILTVIMRDKNDSKGNSRWLCKCGCGNTKIVYGSNLKNGHTKSCGCQWKAGRKPKDLTGMRFGALTVLKSLGTRTITYCDSDKIKRQMFLCQCDCGNLKEYSSCDLHSGVKTCGCRNRSLYSTEKENRNERETTTL